MAISRGTVLCGTVGLMLAIGGWGPRALAEETLPPGLEGVWSGLYTHAETPGAEDRPDWGILTTTRRVVNDEIACVSEYMGCRIGHTITIGTYKWNSATGQLDFLSGGLPATRPDPDKAAPYLVAPWPGKVWPGNGYGPAVGEWGDRGAHGIAVQYRVADAPAVDGLAGVWSGPSSDGTASWSFELSKDGDGYKGLGTWFDHSMKTIVQGTVVAAMGKERWEITWTPEENAPVALTGWLDKSECLLTAVIGEGDYGWFLIRRPYVAPKTVTPAP